MKAHALWARWPSRGVGWDRMPDRVVTAVQERAEGRLKAEQSHSRAATTSIHTVLDSLHAVNNA